MNFKILKNKKIYEILDGDSKFEEYTFKNGKSMKISFPYLSGPAICGIAHNFGLNLEYSTFSRWSYVEFLLEHCIEQNKVSDLLNYFFSLENFSDFFPDNLSSNEIEEAHEKFKEVLLGKINGVLFYSGHELVKVGSSFQIIKLGKTADLLLEKISKIDHDYIISVSKRAQEDIKRNDYDSSITKARTLLEEIFCYAIEQKGKQTNSKGKIKELYKEVKTLYNMHTDPNLDVRINSLLSGLETILTSISEIRNLEGDSHGKGSKRIGIEEHHATLVVNAATIFAEFMLSIVENNI